jgi:hypothetical protein
MTKSKRKWPVIVAIGFAVVFIAAVAYSTLGNAQYRAEVCVTFKGSTICRDGAGATRENAERVGLDLACTDFGGGMTPFMQCEQNAPHKVTWK